MGSADNGHRPALHFAQPPQRVVSLVPSTTESLFELGFGDSVVGITDYCTHPAESLSSLPRVGGTKNARLADILALRPDLVVANQEENTKSLVEELEAHGAPVWVTFPRTVREALDVLWTLTRLYRSQRAAMQIETLERVVDWMDGLSEDRPKWRYFCPIWQHTSAGQAVPEESGDGQGDWWMTFNARTYSDDLLRLLGGENVFAQRERRYPLTADLGQAAAEPAGERDTRYPRLTLEEIRAADPEVILLPDEPYVFGDEDAQRLSALLPECAAVRQQQVILLDGSLLSWHGVRLGKALQTLPGILPGG